MKEYYIKTNTVEERRIILGILFSEGFLWHGETGYTPKSVIEKWSEYPVVSFRIRDKYVKGFREATNWVKRSQTLLVTAEDVVKAIAQSEKPTSIPISNFAGTGYDAVITSTEIKVGCQTISKETVEELLKKMSEVTEQEFEYDGSSKVYIKTADATSYEAWLRTLENLGYKYADNCGVYTISEAISSGHWRNYPSIQIRPFEKVVCGQSGDISKWKYNFENPWDVDAWKFVLGLSKWTAVSTLKVGDYTATIQPTKIIIDGHNISKEEIENVLKQFNELSN